MIFATSPVGACTHPDPLHPEPYTLTLTPYLSCRGGVQGHPSRAGRAGRHGEVCLWLDVGHGDGATPAAGLIDDGVGVGVAVVVFITCIIVAAAVPEQGHQLLPRCRRQHGVYDAMHGPWALLCLEHLRPERLLVFVWGACLFGALGVFGAPACL